MSKIFTKISLIFYIFLMIFFLPYFSWMSIGLYSSIILTILLYKKLKFKSLLWLRMPFLLASIFLIYKEYGTWRGFEPASILFSTLVILKVFELKTKRDIYSLVLIQFLHIISLSLLVEDFYYLFIIFISLVISFSNIYILSQLSIGEAHYRKGVKKILKYSLYGAPIVIILFLVFPRFNFGGFLLSTTTATTGFSEELKPGDISEIIKDPSVVFHVKFTKRFKRLDMYWRGQILAKNNNFDWSKTPLPERRNTETIYKKFDYFVTYDTLASGPLYTLEKTRKVSLTSAGSVISRKGNLYFSTPLLNQKSKFKGWLGPKVAAKLSKNYKQTYLQVDIPKNSKVQNFIKENEQLKGKPTEVALFLKDFFRKNFLYSTAPGVYTGESALDEFLFSRRVGFCGHYASASATLFRLFDIPARVVVGYQGGLYNDVGDFYIITNKDAHTWIEYLDESGIWTRFDAVSVISPERIAYGADAYFEYERFRGNSTNIEEFISSRSGVLSDWRQYLQNIYYQSGTLFFNYDLEAQRELFRGLLKYKYRDSSIAFYLPYILLFSLFYLIFRFRVKLQSVLLYFCILKYERMNWHEFSVLSEAQLMKSIEGRSDHLRDLLLFHQSLRYDRGESLLKELSFFLRAFRILIYG
ncbi:hypothetical protein BIY24_06390 [Halobacteriovorax marinus]|uniref:transglutaminase family protein n=1 Tax=Halobacteriovorax marinus TaxID=97084 RepID=UPI000BC3541F|nr:DUF3488 and transglutaminase-like domain-containing protein [Halobacteriovorax marinus]ATH07586.1 hypothetical protein BIY24_06390 [Halobacteriovorax marinus]